MDASASDHWKEKLMGKVFTEWKMIMDDDDDDYVDFPRTDVEHEQAQYLARHKETPDAFRRKGTRRAVSEPPILKGRSQSSGYQYFGGNESFLVREYRTWVLPPQPEGWTICTDGLSDS